MGKIAVLTASFGGIDEARRFPWKSESCDSFAISEKNCPFPFNQLDARMKSKYFKLQAHRVLPAHYTHVVWIDANVEIKAPSFVEEIIGAGKFDIAVARHPFRNCIYEEAAFVVDGIASGDKYLAARYSPEVMRIEADFYKKHGHPADFGLWWCGLFARPINAQMNGFFDAWWNACLLWSSFDQNSFPFLARQFGIEIREMVWGDFYDNPTYKMHRHLKVQ